MQPGGADNASGDQQRLRFNWLSQVEENRSAVFPRFGMGKESCQIYENMMQIPGDTCSELVADSLYSQPSDLRINFGERQLMLNAH